MKAVVLAAGEGTRLRPLTADKPKGMVEVAGKPILTHCFEQLIELGAEELLVVVGYKKQAIINHYEDEYDGVPITAAFLVEEVPWEEASRYGVCDTNKYGEITEVIEKPEEPPSNLVMTGFYTFTPAIFHACHLVQPSNRDEYEISDAIDLLLHSGRTIDAIRMDGWRNDIGYPEDRDQAEKRLQGEVDPELAAENITADQ